MAIPFAHTSVSHLIKTGRRRSQSVTIPNEIEEDAPEKSIQRKQFFVQLQKERQKQQNSRHGHHKEQLDDHEEQEQDKDHQPVVTRVPGASNTHSIKKHTSSMATSSVPLKEHKSLTNSKNPASEDDEQYQPVVTRVPGAHSTHPTNKHRSSSAFVSGPTRKQRTLTTCKTPTSNDEGYHQTIVARIPGANNTQLTKKNTSSFATTSVPLKEQRSLTNFKTPTVDDDKEHQPSVARVKRSDNTTSMKKNALSTGAISSTLHGEITSGRSNSESSEENEQHHGHKSQVTRIPRSESAVSFKKQISTTSGKNPNVNTFTTLKNSNIDSSAVLKGNYFESSQTSSNLLVSSSINLMSKSEIFDQEFYLDNSKDHVRRNDTKRHGKINISGQEHHESKYERRLSARSSAAFMAAIIAIIIAVIAFAFGLTSLVLVLLLRSTVATQLGRNSTSSGSSSISIGNWTSGCSTYTTLDDPTRYVYAAGYALGCDNTAPFLNRTTPVWIRFIGTGGTTLPLTTPGMNLCGSEGTGWYDGDMPSIAGQLINGTACFTWYNSVCRYSLSISVANCGSFYIYLLPPAPACMMRYCTI